MFAFKCVFIRHYVPSRFMLVKNTNMGGVPFGRKKLAGESIQQPALDVSLPYQLFANIIFS
ncbi:hypothetical protein SAMN04488109_0868 [Chryseolinea serpens]|uniref:Uncharacterized protein n=1 Tax=Chryseolinea serpens TaxID=947013 RepID=A0A1M5KVN5_9BACT|nr:hypothetical protein SAMN04488109_0868 [Chryseolinea serpens]